MELLTAATLEVIYKRLRQKDLALVKLNLRCNVIWEIVRAGDRTGRSQAIALNTTLTRLDPSVPIRCWRGEGSAVIHETPMSQACCDDSCDVCLKTLPVGTQVLSCQACDCDGCRGCPAAEEKR